MKFSTAGTTSWARSADRRRNPRNPRPPPDRTKCARSGSAHSGRVRRSSPARTLSRPTRAAVVLRLPRPCAPRDRRYCKRSPIVSCPAAGTSGWRAWSRSAPPRRAAPANGLRSKASQEPVRIALSMQSVINSSVPGLRERGGQAKKGAPKASRPFIRLSAHAAADRRRGAGISPARITTRTRAPAHESGGRSCAETSRPTHPGRDPSSCGRDGGPLEPERPREFPCLRRRQRGTGG